MEEFRCFPFEGVPDELKRPSEQEERESEFPKRMIGNTGQSDDERNYDRGNAECVAETIDGMLMTGRVLGDPLFAGASA